MGVVSSEDHQLHVAIAVAPSGLTLEKELRLIKASLLYADTISLYSPAAILFDSVALLADAPDKAKFGLIAELATEMGQSDVVDELLSLRSMIESIGNERRRILARVRFERALSEAWKPLREKALEMLEQAGMHDLAHLVEIGLVQVHPVGAEVSADGDQMAKAMTARIADILTSATCYPLFDDLSAKLASAMVEMGYVRLDKAREARGVKVTSAVTFVGHLPSFEDADLMTLLEAREAVSDHLGLFRSAVREVGHSFESSAFTPELRLEIDDAWAEAVKPQLDQIAQSLADGGYLKALVRRTFTDPTSFASASLAVGSMAMTQLPDFLAAAGLAVPAIGAAFDEMDRRKQLRGNRWYLLHQAEQFLDRSR